MNNIDFFKLKAKNIFKDYKTRYLDEDGTYDYKPKYFDDIWGILYDWGVDEENFTLMKAQHIIAQMAGFKNWSDLIHSSEARLEIHRSLFERLEDDSFAVEDWLDYEEENLKDFDDESKLQVYKIVFLNDKSILKN